MTASVSTVPFVPADDRVFGPVAHNPLWLVVGVLAVAGGVWLAWWALRTVPDAAAVRSARPSVKERYLADLDELQRQWSRRRIDERQLHHALSRLVRRFAAEHGTPTAVAMTPTELDGVGLAGVAGVVAGYQPTQFMERTASDPPASLDAARAVIRAW